MASAQTSGEPERRYTLLSLSVIIAAGLLIYAGTFNSPFVFDDLTNIVDNPYIMVTEVSADRLAGILKSPVQNRPVANATFALNYWIHNHRVGGYHVVNLLIHLMTAALVFLVARQTAALCRLESRLFPLLAALLWMTSPVHTQSVTYIVQRMTSLAALFYLLALFCYIRARGIQLNRSGRGGKSTRWFIACALAALLGLATKETAAFLIPFILIYEWYFFQNLDRHWIKRRYQWVLAALVVFLMAASIYTRCDPAGQILSDYARHPFTMAQRLLTQPRVILYYISLIACPHPSRLNLDYDFPLARSLSDPVTVLSLTALICLAGAAVYEARRHRLLSFAILWFLGNLVVESSFLGLEIIFEHRTYLPSVFPMMALTSCLIHRPEGKRTMATLIILTTFVFGIWTFGRNTVWQNEIDLWLDSAEKSPGKARPFNHLGLACGRSGRNPLQAADYLNTALALSLNRWGRNHPLTAIHHYNLGEIYRVTGNTNQATAHYHQALTLIDGAENSSRPGMATIYNNLAAMRKADGDINGAIAGYRKALSALPDPAKTSGKTIINAAGIYNNLAVACAAQGDRVMAEKYSKKALDMLKKEFGDRHPYTERAEKALHELTRNRPTESSLPPR